MSKSKERLIEQLMSHREYGGWNHPNRGYSPFAWPLKLRMTDMSGKNGEYKVLERFDEEWEKYCDEVPVWYWAIDGARASMGIKDFGFYKHPSNKEANQPYEFAWAGRRSGWLIFSKWKQYDFLDLYCTDDVQELLEQMSAEELTELVRIVAGMDNDFTVAKAYRAFDLAINEMRYQWEVSLLDEEEEIALENGEAYVKGWVPS